jgi:hypothetical protein
MCLTITLEAAVGMLGAQAQIALAVAATLNDGLDMIYVLPWWETLLAVALFNLSMCGVAFGTTLDLFGTALIVVVFAAIVSGHVQPQVLLDRGLAAC